MFYLHVLLGTKIGIVVDYIYYFICLFIAALVGSAPYVLNGSMSALV